MNLFNSFKNKGTQQNDNSSWNNVSDVEIFQTILKKSNTHPQLIYKHSHRCSASLLSKIDLDANKEKIKEVADLNFVDVIQQREVSNKISSELNIRHESPQALLIKDGKIVWSGSHWQVNSHNILSNLT